MVHGGGGGTDAARTNGNIFIVDRRLHCLLLGGLNVSSSLSYILCLADPSRRQNQTANASSGAHNSWIEPR